LIGLTKTIRHNTELLSDPEEVFTAKHVAAQRFQRNHKLMLDLFSDFKIPELGIVVTEVRLNALKQQVNGLVTHKRKLDDEMDESGKFHESKKLKIKTESEKFWTEYNKVTLFKNVFIK